MRYWLEKDMRPVELALEACRQTGVEPFSAPVRGGTDGSRLTEMGVPCPTSSPACRRSTARANGSASRTWPPPSAMCLRLAELWGAEKP